MTMPMSAAMGAAGDVRIGDIFGRAFGVLSRHFLAFTLLAAVAAVPAALITMLSSPSSTSWAAQLAAGGQINFAALITAVLLGIGGALLWSVLAVVAQAMILYGAFQDMRGKPVDIVESAKKGLSRFWPIIGLGTSVGLTVAFGFVLLFVPGLIFATMYYVALPACVVEKTGPLASMSRSAALTKGHRWKVFGLYLVLAIVGIIANLVVSKVFVVFGGPILAAATVIWGSLFGAYRSITVTVLYHDLRATREGIDVEQMAAVFD